MKTTDARYAELEANLRERHPWTTRRLARWQSCGERRRTSAG
ncbi:hypothetical protein [Kribbella sp. HUAS MG21]